MWYCQRHNSISIAIPLCYIQNQIIKNSNVNEVTMNYKKFIIVREPIERLLSAFNDLFIVSDRKGLQREALKIRGARKRKITFNDFIQAVVLPQDKVGKSHESH